MIEVGWVLLANIEFRGKNKEQNKKRIVVYKFKWNLNLFVDKDINNE
jgi:hypothetical protein